VVGEPSCKNTHQSIFLEKILGNIEQFFLVLIYDIEISQVLIIIYGHEIWLYGFWACFFSDSFRSAVGFEGESDGGSDLSEVADHK